VFFVFLTPFLVLLEVEIVLAEGTLDGGDH